jgi:flagellar hook-associated protein 3 FlgL
MTISTSLLFSRAVNLMTQQQSELAKLQEKVSLGKELVRPSDSPDLAVNVARIKSTLEQLDAYKSSLNSVNDRLTIEESYLTGAKDVLIKIKQLAIQGANASLNDSDRKVVALEVDELVSEMQNLANGTDANGNFLFAGSRVATAPYQAGDDGVIRYTGDTFRPQLDYSSQRRSSVGRNGPDVFRPVVSGNMLAPVPAVYQLKMSGTLEVGDLYSVEIDGYSLGYEVRPGDSVEQVMERIVFQINESVLSGELDQLSASVVDGTVQILTLDGTSRAISGSSRNASQPVDDLTGEVSGATDDGSFVGQIGGTMERGDQLKLSIGSRSFTYVITGEEAADLGVSDARAAVIESMMQKIGESRLFAEQAEIAAGPGVGEFTVTPRRDPMGTVSLSVTNKTSINDQGLIVEKTQEPVPPVPERVEFFESLQELSTLLKASDQDGIQGKLAHLDQMLDIVTFSLADIGSEMNTLSDEIEINEDLTLQMQASLSGQEDIDYAKAITELQAKMMSLEAAQSSFAKISQLSVFDYIR